jgi:mRNA degradation ribonuclease J1/J2
MDEKALAAIGDKGIDALIGDSTNSTQLVGIVSQKSLLSTDSHAFTLIGMERIRARSPRISYRFNWVCFSKSLL